MTHSEIAPITSENANPKSWALNFSKVRFSDPKGRPDIFSTDVNFVDEVTSVALIETAFNRWARDMDGSSAKMIRIPPKDAAEALILFDGFVAVSPDAFAHEYEIAELREMLQQSAFDGFDIVIVPETD